jgi:hypothetical protein
MKKLTVYLTELGYTVPAVLNGAVLLEQIVAVVMVTYVLMRYVMYLKKI